MNVDIEQTVKYCTTYLGYQCTQPQETALYYEIPYKSWEVFGTDIFMVNNKSLLCIVHYYSKFPIMKKVAGLSADDLVHTTKVIFCSIWIA